jgi:hypothetical protein
MSHIERIDRGWIYVDGRRADDGSFSLGSGGVLRFSPFDAIRDRRAAQIPWSAIL